MNTLSIVFAVVAILVIGANTLLSLKSMHKNMGGKSLTTAQEEQRLRMIIERHTGFYIKSFYVDAGVWYADTCMGIKAVDELLKMKGREVSA